MSYHKGVVRPLGTGVTTTFTDVCGDDPGLTALEEVQVPFILLLYGHNVTREFLIIGVRSISTV